MKETKKGCKKKSNNRYRQEGRKEKEKNIMKITKKNSKNKYEVSIENYIMKTKKDCKNKVE